MNDKEMKGNTLPVVTASTEKKEVTVIRGAGQRQQRTTYNFDNVLTSFSTQQEVFNQTIEPVIGDVLSGFECTMFAYGQTGTGKTHTMEGDFMNEDNRGVIPRAAQALFERLSNEAYIDYTVKASYLEIYNEDLADLLVQHGQDVKLQIVEDTRQRGKGIFVQNLSETAITEAADVLTLMQRAQERRKVGETKMNKHSSRSHCLFTITVTSKKRVNKEGDVMECSGKLHLVDLAGSECAKTAGMEDPKKERERKNINQSLLTLGRVISALREGNVQRIPYRDSKLTRLLQVALSKLC
jgi:kinesin family protein 11